MRRKQKSPAARRTKRAKALNNKPTENGEPPFGAASLARAWKPKRQKTASHLSELHLLRVRGNQTNRKRRATFRSCISCACVETKTTENGEPPLGAASLSRAWKPKRLNTKTKASDYGCISRACGNFRRRSSNIRT